MNETSLKSSELVKKFESLDSENASQISQLYKN